MVGMFSKPKKQPTPWSVGKPLAMDLPVAPGVRLSALPSIPELNMPSQTSTVPQANILTGEDNFNKLLGLLQSYSGGMR